VDPLGGVTRSYYDAFDRPQQVVANLVDPNYATLDELIAVAQPPAYNPAYPDRNVPLWYAYDAVGNRIAETNANGVTTRTYYDVLHRPVLQVANLAGWDMYNDQPPDCAQVVCDQATNLRSDWFYDAAGNLIAVMDPQGTIVRTYYDSLNRPTQVVENLVDAGYANVIDLINAPAPPAFNPAYPDQNVPTGYEYDALGNQTARIDPNNVTTRYEYDGLNHLTAVTENYLSNPPSGSDPNSVNVRTTYEYDLNGNLTATHDANGHITTYGYDAFNQVITQTLPGSPAAVTLYQYDPAGNLLSLKDANTSVDLPENRTRYAYDGLGRPIGIDYPGSDPDAAFSYDLLGRLQGMQDGLGTTQWGYDGLNRVLSVLDPFGDQVGYAYDGLGRLTGLAYPGVAQPVQYTYDPLNRLQTVRDWGQNQTQYSYDEAGRLVGADLPNGV
jgi:YD repeat-containing protein